MEVVLWFLIRISRCCSW